MKVILNRKKETKVMTLILRGEKVTMGMTWILSRETEGIELNLKKRESDQGAGTNSHKGESDKEDKIDSKVPKYKVGTFVIKDVDNIWCTGVIHRSGFDKTSFLYFVHSTELDLKEAIIEDDIDKLVFSSDDWIVMKDLDVFVKVGSSDHRAKIDSMVRLCEELVDTKLFTVTWVINNKKEVVDISSVRPMYSSEGNNQNKRSTKPSKPPSVIPLRTEKSKEGLLEESTYPRKLLVGLSYKCKHYINCNSLPAKQKGCKDG